MNPIACRIEPSPYLPSVDEARICDAGVPVWAPIGYFPAVSGDMSVQQRVQQRRRTAANNSRLIPNEPKGIQIQNG